MNEGFERSYQMNKETADVGAKIHDINDHEISSSFTTDATSDNCLKNTKTEAKATAKKQNNLDTVKDQKREDKGETK